LTTYDSARDHQKTALSVKSIYGGMAWTRAGLDYGGWTDSTNGSPANTSARWRCRFEVSNDVTRSLSKDRNIKPPL